MSVSKKLAANLIVSSAFVVSAAAVTINVDIGGGGNRLYNGSGVAGGGTTWNTAAQGLNSNLVDSTGSATTVDLTLSDGNSIFDSDGPQSNGHVANRLLRDYFYVSTSDPTGSLDFAQLATNSLYDVYVYTGGNAVDQNTTISIEGTALSVTTAAPNQSTTDFTLNEDYVLFSNIDSGASGQISVNFESGGLSQFGAVNGAQLVLVPEPSSALLIALGCGALALRRSRRQ